MDSPSAGLSATVALVMRPLKDVILLTMVSQLCFAIAFASPVPTYILIITAVFGTKRGEPAPIKNHKQLAPATQKVLNATDDVTDCDPNFWFVKGCGTLGMPDGMFERRGK